MPSARKTAASRMLRAQRARQMGGLPTAGFFGDALGFIGDVAGALIPGVGPVIDIVSGIVGGGDKPPPVARQCRTGFLFNPSTGQCEKQGIVGAVQQFLPGGATGTVPATTNGYGQAVVGTWGVPALVPATVSGITRRCPPGAILGQDDLCYQKGSIPAKYRKWKPEKKGPISAADWKDLQTADRVRKKSKAIAVKAGFKCVNK